MYITKRNELCCRIVNKYLFKVKTGETQINRQAFG